MIPPRQQTRQAAQRRPRCHSDCGRGHSPRPWAQGFASVDCSASRPSDYPPHPPPSHPPVSGPQLALRCIPFIFPLAVPPVPQAPADQCGMWVLTLPSGQSPAHSQPSFMLFRPHDVTLPQHATDHIKFSPPTALTRHRRTQVKTPVTWTHLFSPGLTVCHIPNPGSRIPISSNACTLIPYVLSTDSLPSIRAMDRP